MNTKFIQHFSFLFFITLTPCYSEVSVSVVIDKGLLVNSGLVSIGNNTAIQRVGDLKGKKLSNSHATVQTHVLGNMTTMAVANFGSRGHTSSTNNSGKNR